MQYLLHKKINIVEVRLEKEKNIPSVWSWDLEKISQNLLKKFDKIGFHLPFIDLNILSTNPRVKTLSNEIIVEGIIKANEIGANYVVIHSDSRISLNNFKQFDTILNIVSQTKLYLCIENAGNIKDLRVLGNLIKEIDHPKVKMMLDIGHAYTRIKVKPFSYILRYFDKKINVLSYKKNMPFEKYKSLRNFIEENLDNIYGFHLHDNDGKSDHLNLGDGMIDFSFLSYLSKTSFDGPLIIESRMNSYDQINLNIDLIQRFIK